jgi:ADP-ribose pyrophosphatase
MDKSNHNKVKILKKESLYSGYAKLERYTLQTELFSGSLSPTYTRELFQRKPAVAVLPYDPVLDKVVLIEQFRVGALSEKNPWLLEIVAGVKDDDQDESLESLLKRELAEEAGLEALAITPICNYFSSPGAYSEKVFLYCAKVDASKAPKFAGLKKENEDIKIHVIKTSSALTLLHENNINNAATIIALQWLELNLEKLRTLFQNN